MKASKVTRIWWSRQKSSLWEVQLCKPPGLCCLLCSFLPCTQRKEQAKIPAEDREKSSENCGDPQVPKSSPNFTICSLEPSDTEEPSVPQMRWREKSVFPQACLLITMCIYMLEYSGAALNTKPFKSDSLCEDIPVLVTFKSLEMAFKSNCLPSAFM